MKKHAVLRRDIGAMFPVLKSAAIHFTDKVHAPCKCALYETDTYMIYSDTTLIVTRMDSLKDRREMLMARFFKKQVLTSNALLLNHVTMTLSTA